MRYFLILLLIIFSASHSLSIEQDQLISEYDLDFLFKNDIKKWNESVVFFDKKNSMSKVNNNDEIYFLKSFFQNGSVIIKPYFNKNKVSKIYLEYELEIIDQNLNNLILKHYNKLENNYCTNIIDNISKIIIQINICD